MFAEDFLEEDELTVECEICGGDVIIDDYVEEDDIVYCNDCEAEYLIDSFSPLKLELLEDDYDEVDDDEDFD